MPDAILDPLLLLGGLVLLTYAADKFVEGAVRVSTLLRVPIVLVGALVIGFGTSAPELLVSAIASIEGKQDIAIGNIVGSNTANLLLVLGATGSLAALPITARIWRREVRLMFVAVALLTVFAWDLRLVWWEATILVLGAAASIMLIIAWARVDRELAAELADEVAEFSGGSATSLPAASLRTLLGLLGTLAGAQMLVEGASGVAEQLGMSEAVIGLTIVAVGTSLPELVTGLAATRKGETDLIIGNVVGSNVFNSLPVAGLAALLDTRPLDPQLTTNLLIMVAATVAFAVIIRRDYRIQRWEGGVLLVGFVAATVATL